MFFDFLSNDRRSCTISLQYILQQKKQECVIIIIYVKLAVAWVKASGKAGFVFLGSLLWHVVIFQTGITVSCQASTHFDGRYRELFNINNYYFIFRQFIEQFSKVVRLITRTITCRKYLDVINQINDTALARITATHIPKNTLFSCVNEAEIIH
ncbi:uncharacterized protein OCT59_027161 [Rhizophagus irregularis]|uniref:uncharacterized protein n=1 Tax=Rhizophagus irregularis TaxID=588596 RepID=UPI00333014DA|nr:hypothetical protein OCT59_027161 [Rhizophagus irregularis]